MVARPFECAGVNALTVIESAVPELVSRFGATAVVLYGSHAHGTADRWSDIDVAVVSPKFGTDPVRETRDLLEFFEHVDLRVEPRAFSREEWEHSKPGDFLYDEVREKGIVVFGDVEALKDDAAGGDLADLVGKGVFALWRDYRAFEQVRIRSSGELVWCDKVDLCPDSLYLKVTGKKPEEVFPALRQEPARA